MTTLQSRKLPRGNLHGFLATSLFIHVVVLAALSFVPRSPPPEEPPAKKRDFRVALVTPPQPPPQPQAPPVIPAPLPEEIKKVVQPANATEPEKADHVAPDANKVEVEEVAKGNPDATAQAPLEEPASESQSEQSESQNPPVDLAKLFNVPLNAQIRPDGVAEQRAKAAMKANNSNKKVLADFDARDKAFRQSIESFGSEVGVGNHTSVNAYSDDAKSYLERIHRKIHKRWADGYLPYLDTGVPMDSPLRNPNLNTILEMIIDGSSGQVERVNIVKTSGELSYDSEAIIIAQTIGPHGAAPHDVISPNGKVYVHWNFWRDTRQCGTFGASIFIVNKDG
ncbi:MAG: hypothetical protein R3E66_15730 [bacterium]